MKRYASHFLFLPGHGYLKQYVVEIGEGQCVSRIFPLTEEVENTEWSALRDSERGAETEE